MKKKPSKLKSAGALVNSKSSGVRLKSNGALRKTNGIRYGRIEAHKSVESEALSDRDLLRILIKVKNGNFSVRLPEGQSGLKKSISDALNEIIDLNERMVFEFTKVGNTIGKQGKLTNRVSLEGAK